MPQHPRPRRPPTAKRIALAAAGVTAGVVLALVALAPASASAQGLIPAPATSVSPDGRHATDGIRTLEASQTQGLAAAGSSVTVTGSGYDTNKGIYVAFCLIPPTNQQPTPCGGGVDTTGASGSSQWVSSNAPTYGEGLATPYGPGGTFSLTIDVSPQINGSIDCRRVRCAIVTRNDHTRTSDRGQDIFLPVTFAAEVEPPPGADGSSAPTTTTTAPQAVPAPPVLVSGDGRLATAGTLVVELSQARDLDRIGQPVAVTGAGFDEAKGIGVAFCVVDPDGQVPGPCADGSANASSAVAWISSNPPEGSDAAVPYQLGGAFSLSIATSPKIGDVDCTVAACAIVTSNDVTHPLDRSQDIVLPVTFRAAAQATSTSTAMIDTDLAATAELESSTSVWPFVLAGAAFIAAGCGLAYVIVRKRELTKEPPA